APGTDRRAGSGRGGEQLGLRSPAGIRGGPYWRLSHDLRGLRPAPGLGLLATDAGSGGVPRPRTRNPFRPPQRRQTARAIADVDPERPRRLSRLPGRADRPGGTALISRRPAPRRGANL